MDLKLVWRSALAVLAGSVVSVIAFRRRKKSPPEKERRRRDCVSTQGRIIEGYVTGCQNGTIEYSYHWQGIRYEASQDVLELIESDNQQHDFSGPVTVKFLNSQPSNSIVLAENWSGIPSFHRRTAPNGQPDSL
jgi:hypothetical protein